MTCRGEKTTPAWAKLGEGGGTASNHVGQRSMSGQAIHNSVLKIFPNLKVVTKGEKYNTVFTVWQNKRPLPAGGREMLDV